MLLVILAGLVSCISGLHVKLEYSLDDWATAKPLGQIEFSSIEDNYTGVFHVDTAANGLADDLYAHKDGIYRVRAESSLNSRTLLQSSTSPCLILRSQLVHEFFVALSPRTLQISTVTVYPSPGFFLEEECPRISQQSAKAVVMVSQQTVLPSPDTQSYLEKLEKEKKARQHGAESDNRGFLQKYWMYIVPVVIFVFISNLANPEGGQQGGE